MNEQELNKKLAEWRFGDKLHYCGHFIGFWREDTTEKRYGICEPFTQSLDACFKWLVPKFVSVASQLPMGLPSIIHIYGYLFNEWLKILGEEKEPAFAFCLAIEKILMERRIEQNTG